MESTPTPAYGASRDRQANVSYGDVEGAAFQILSEGRRPSVETIRQHLNRGSPPTIASCLKRFWQTFATRAQGDPAALSRMPSEIAELADSLWQRALKLASDAAQQDDNGARERLAQIQMENEIRAQSFVLRERELDAQARARERALADSRDHLLSVMKALSREQATLEARDARIADLESQVDQLRQQLASILASAIAEQHHRPRMQTRRRTAPPEKQFLARVKRRPKAAKARTPRPKKETRSATRAGNPPKGAAANKRRKPSATARGRKPRKPK